MAVKMKAPFSLLPSILLIINFSGILSDPDSLTVSTISNSIPDYPHLKQKQLLDAAAGYTLEWDVDRNTNSVIFHITAKVSGHLALGISKKGQVEGADVAVFGFRSGIGNSYIIDTYGITNSSLRVDNEQNWRIVNAQKLGGKMVFSVVRNLDTCDDQDLRITNDLLHIIWGYSNSSEYGSLLSNFIPKGNIKAYLLDKKIFQNSVNSHYLQNWRVSREFHIAPRHTSYWCSMVKGPSLKKKNHIVGFGPYFANELSRRHVNYQLVYRCTAPPGVDPALIFEPFLNHPGEECNMPGEHELPSAFCREIIFVWNVGGRGAYLPEDTGFPIGATENEYFMFESQYNNPKLRSDLLVENGVDLQFTPLTRPNDGSIVFMGHSVTGLFGVPPQSTDYNVVGHCSPDCTKRMFEPGTEVIGVMPHAHLTTRKNRLRHYRGNNELPWLQNDENYDFNFQKLHFLPKPVPVLPGDQFTSQCSFDNTQTNSATVSGLATRNEMCNSFVYFNKRISHFYCLSQYPLEKVMEKFGIRNMTWNLNAHETIVTDADSPKFTGKMFSEVVTTRFSWTTQERKAWEREQIYSVHGSSCPSVKEAAQLAYTSIARQLATNGRFDPWNINATSVAIGSGTSSKAIYPVVPPPYRPPTLCQTESSLLDSNSGISGRSGWGKGASTRF